MAKSRVRTRTNKMWNEDDRAAILARSLKILHENPNRSLIDVLRTSQEVLDEGKVRQIKQIGRPMYDWYLDGVSEALGAEKLNRRSKTRTRRKAPAAEVPDTGSVEVPIPPEVPPAQEEPEIELPAEEALPLLGALVSAMREQRTILERHERFQSEEVRGNQEDISKRLAQFGQRMDRLEATVAGVVASLKGRSKPPPWVEESVLAVLGVIRQHNPAGHQLPHHWEKGLIPPSPAPPPSPPNLQVPETPTNNVPPKPVELPSPKKMRSTRIVTLNMGGGRLDGLRKGVQSKFKPSQVLDRKVFPGEFPKMDDVDFIIRTKWVPEDWAQEAAKVYGVYPRGRLVFTTGNVDRIVEKVKPLPNEVEET